MFVSILTLYELMSVVESVAYVRKYGRKHGDRADLKAFRAIESERAAMMKQLRAIWSQLVSFSHILDAPLSSGAADISLALYERSALDGYDVPIVITARAANVTTIVTHDVDFGSVADIVVLTANPRLLDTSR